MSDTVQRRRARQLVENDPGARERYDEMLSLARALTGAEGDERDIGIAILDLVFDLNPPPPQRLHDHDPHKPMAEREDGRPDVMWSSISFPLATDDFLRRREEVQLIYAMREIMAWLSGGITPVELADLSLGGAWDVISKWVDDVRRPQPTHVEPPATRAQRAAAEIDEVSPGAAAQVRLTMRNVEARMAAATLLDSKIWDSEHGDTYLKAKVILHEAVFVGAFNDVEVGDDLWRLD